MRGRGPAIASLLAGLLPCSIAYALASACGLVTRNVLRLELRLLIRREPKPVHIRDDSFNVLRPTARSVNILNTQMERTAKSPRKIMRTKRRKGVPQM